MPTGIDLGGATCAFTTRRITARTDRPGKKEDDMHVERVIVSALFAAMLLAPTVASAARSCITNVAGDTCLAHCIGDLQQGCGNDPACHQEVAAALQMLASTPAGTPLCAAA